ncbi:2',3'-cyclic-nucleotide 3'-phosphodiesterase [Thozetella sp. PMI_491]|nr:2',3'-cyclic-nucleotide 3'-phosphodiesterase [Thozetella sp. PMI_491]
MPGSSLWLVPPPSHPLYQILTELIEKKLPASFPGESLPVFSPHLTLTSEIPPEVYGDRPQEWLDSIAWPDKSQVAVDFEHVKTEDIFFRRCYIKARFEGASGIAALARARGVNDEPVPGPKTEAWLAAWKESFGPHVSLVYGNFTINEEKLAEVSTMVQESQVKLYSSGEEAGGNSPPYAGWQGGVVWLVPTDLSIPDWKPIATKELV